MKWNGNRDNNQMSILYIEILQRSNVHCVDESFKDNILVVHQVLNVVFIHLITVLRNAKQKIS